MKAFIPFILLIIALSSCGSTKTNIQSIPSDGQHTIIFASCNDPHRPMPLWDDIRNENPDVFIWGGDNVYADTDNMEKMEADYDLVWASAAYQKLAEEAIVIGTWDDHDYGKNDAGEEWEMKDEAQTELLNFLKVSANDPRRNREGVYHAETFNFGEGSVKVILLDTRYFRSALKPSDDPDRRYDAWEEGEGGTMLGNAQWNWLQEELENDSADFTLVVSSIQVLADQHGWEKWGNMPEEQARLLDVIRKAKANNIIILSGDRHQAEVSVTTVPGLDYPLIDFTSSGLTHTWPETPMDENVHRVGEGTKQLNYGVLYFDFNRDTVQFEIRGDKGVLYQTFTQKF
ncbi:alkaline phosphatase family protein [Flavobacteriaceae bacterium TK19130]|nr:alkaline phosphatase family protein [Thermobacterium salinum]